MQFPNLFGEATGRIEEAINEVRNKLEARLSQHEDRFNRHNAHLNQHEDRFSRLEARINGCSKRIDAHQDQHQLCCDTDNLKTKLDSYMQELSKRLDNNATRDATIGFNRAELVEDIAFLVHRARTAGCYWLNDTNRDYGISANALVTYAYGGPHPAQDERPHDQADLDACGRAFTNLPRHRKQPVVAELLHEYIAEHNKENK